MDVFFLTFFKLYKWYQIVQSIINCLPQNIQKKIREKNKDLKFSRIFKDFYADSLKVLKVLPATVTGYQLILARKRK